MKTKLAVQLLVAAFAVTPFIAGADSHKTEAKNDMSTSASEATTKTGVYLDDAAITTKVKAEFMKDDDVSGFGTSVKTKNGVVWLSGDAKSKAIADKAVTIAKNVEGVKSVKSKIVVKAE